ncbi:hypothetical protein KGF54_001703 [Candida jiufengensis]|uniref:uncharacterized protein n=1 Tax=Candida jiufengensis TaxID=497108 RepID=UPI002224A460|nr:uncharacterized protein KGF54_001703 [Candida jiufengensis]KAI5955142.1 hypothetical protein KGF54_001703 [Candida jiufengensis]
MTDNVERQKSTRWVKEVPTYGGWGDEDEYDYDYETNDNNINQNTNATTTNTTINESNTNKVPSLPHGILDQYNDSIRKNDASETSVPPPQNDLVLSIDRKNTYNRDTDDSSDDDDQFDDSRNEVAHEVNSPALQPTEKREISQEPEPHHNHEAVPGAFKDDIRLQPDLSTTSLPKPDNIKQPQTNLDEFVVPPTPTYSESSNHEQLGTPSEASFQSDSSIQREPVNLSLKDSTHNRMNSIDNSFDENDDDLILEKEKTIKHQPEKLILSTDKKNENHDDDDSTDDDWGYNGADSSDEEEQGLKQPIEPKHDIDSFIDELNNNHSNEFEKMQIDTSNIDHQELDHPDISPVAPLTIAQQHKTYLDDYAARRRDSVRKPPKKDSGDYSQIVSGYGSEGEQSSINENVDEETSNKRESLDLPPPDLQPVMSSGSLSTGKLSMDSTFKPPDVDRSSRRISQDTFNMGNWAPNTDSFRNQFINDNDNDSTINFDSEVKSKYDKFTKSRNLSGLSEEHSNASSLSVPDTIDVMPNIQEDEQDDDHEIHSHADDTASSKLDTIRTQDSILDNKPYLKPVFGEEKMTPAPSKESLPQKYNSLIPTQPRKASDGSIELSTSKSPSTSLTPNQSKTPPLKLNRETSDSTTLITTPQSTINFTPDKYPVSDWKSIVTISQPIDRINAFKKALEKESNYDSGLQNWLHLSLKQSSDFSNQIHIGRIASQAYENAPHNDLRRYGSFRSKVNVMKDKVEGTGSTATSFGKKLFGKSKKFISGGGDK